MNAAKIVSLDAYRRTRAKERLAAGGIVVPERVAQPIMQAVDALPPAYRRCVHEFGYVDVYRAWRAGWSPERIAARAAERGGVFEL